MDPLAAAAGGGSVRGLAALALPNSSSLTAWAPVAIMAVPVTICSSTFFWYPIASMSLFSKGLASLLQNAASLLVSPLPHPLTDGSTGQILTPLPHQCTNPAESMLCALVSAWALASANILGRYPRSSLRQLQHKARGHPPSLLTKCEIPVVGVAKAKCPA